MRLSFTLFLVALMVALPASTHAFSTPASITLFTKPTTTTTNSALFMSIDNHKRPAFLKSIYPILKPMSIGLFISISTALNPSTALASAPVMAAPRQEMPNPETMAVNKVMKQISQREREKLAAFSVKAREIEQEFGEAARDQFEQEYQAEQLLEAEQKAQGLKQLRLELLEQGICPWVDPEGYRQVFLYRNGLDLATVPGTKYYGDYQLEIRNDKRAFSVEKKPNRDMIKLIVADCKNKGLDLLEYFETHQDKTAQILDYPDIIAEQKLKLFQANVEKYGEPVAPRRGELSLLEKQAADPGREARLQEEVATKAKDTAEKVKADAKEKVIADKAADKAKKEQLKAEAKAMKEKLKAEQAAQKAELQKAKDAAKAAAAAGAIAAANTASDVAAAGVDTTMQLDIDSLSETDILSNDLSEEIVAVAELAATEVETPKNEVITKKLPLIPATAFLMAVGGGAFVLSKSREQAAADEAERQRQFKLIMGISEKDDTDKGKTSRAELPSFDLDELDDIPKPPTLSKPASTSNANDTAETITEIPKKKKGGIRTMFSKKSGNSRESDLSVLVSPDAQAPELASLLAKLLSFGAPGRFPQVDALPGPMPVEDFDLDEAKSLLVDACEAAGRSKEEGAEIFANVVNCMLIDIVDLASAALKEDAAVTFDALNVVIDFMNHAASLYDAVADGVIISPVTYGGTLAKAKLEQMYGSYAFSAMLKMDDVGIEDRIDLLRNVFDINEKKAEGIVMKATQKNMMEMMKNPERMEDLEKLMGGMMGKDGAGLEGLMGGAMGEDGEFSPDQLKEMMTQLKMMKESGALSPEEFQAVGQQFKDAFGSSLSDIVSTAENDKEGMTDDDRELLNLLKEILEV